MSKRAPKPPPLAGFTLLEMAIVLAIIGTILAGGLVVLTGAVEASRVNATTARMDAIHKSLLDYTIAFGRLPCPASLTLATSDSNYGIEAASNSNTCTGGTPAATNVSSTGTVEGAVPTRTLRLPEEYMYDAWGRKFRYATNPTKTASSAFPPASGASCPDTKNITVNDASGNARTTTAAYVLLSHGGNGHGGYSRNGSTMLNASSINTDEQTNCHCDASAAATTYSGTYVQKYPTESTTLTDRFDDIVTFREPWQLQSPNAAMSTSSACTPDIYMLGESAPYLYMYTYHNNTFTALPSPAVTFDSGYFLDLNISPDGTYVAILDGPAAKIYYASGSTLSLIQTIITNGYAFHAIFSPDATYLAVVQNDSPTLRMFKKSGATYSELNNPLDVVHDHVDNVAWSPDGTYLAALTDVSNQYLFVYKRTGDSFATLPNVPATSDHSTNHYANVVDFSSDSNYLVVATSSHNLHILTRTGDNFTLSASTPTLCNGGEVHWSNAGDYFSYVDGCGTTMYSWNPLSSTLTALSSSGDSWEGFGPNDAYAYGWGGGSASACALASDKSTCSPVYYPDTPPGVDFIRARKF